MSIIQKQDLIRNYTLSLEEKSASVFVGAGLSYDVFHLDWTSLVRPYLEQLDGYSGNDLIMGLQYYVTQNRVEPITLKHEIAKKFDGTDYTQNHLLLAKLPISRYWTTNFDILIEEALRSINEPRDIMNSNDSFVPVLERRDNIVYKLHGDINSPNDIIILNDDFRSYKKTHCNFVTALENELATSSVLFLGYSFNDPDIKNIFDNITIKNSSYVQHYFITKRADPDKTAEQNYWIAELGKNGILTCLIDDYTEIEEILRSIYKQYMSRKVLISGSSCGDYGKFSAEEAQKLLYELGYKLIDENRDQSVDIVSGYGLGVGQYLVEGAAEAVATNNLDFGKRILIYPFPKMYYSVPTEKRSPELNEQFEKYREKMIDKCGVVFFLFGNKKSGDQTIIADGVLKEFEIACQQKKYVFPIGSTGWAAEQLAQKVMRDFDKYNPGLKEIKELYYELNDPSVSASRIVEIILDIIDRLAYRTENV